MIRANYEGISYAIFFSIKYNFDINYVVNGTNCICKLLALIFYKKNNDVESVDILIDNAKNLQREYLFEIGYLCTKL